MNSADIVGYAFEGFMICVDCYEKLTRKQQKGALPVFADHEVDFPGDSCEECQEKIDGNLLFQDRDLHRVEKMENICETDKDGEAYTYSKLVYKIDGVDLDDYIHDLVDDIARIEKIDKKNIDDHDYDEKDDATFITVLYH